MISIPEHVNWWKNTFNNGSLPPNRTEGFMEHLTRGGEILGPFVQYARAAGMRAFVSWRMADSQAFANYAGRPLEDQFKDTAKFWFDNRFDPSIALDNKGFNIGGAAQNWASPKVRQYKTLMLQDIITKFRPDGISLDFLRAPLFFNTTETPSAERRSIMGAWVADVKSLMAKTGGNMRLVARIPPFSGILDNIGLDVLGLANSRTFDWLTLGIDYNSFMPMDSEIQAFRTKLPAGFPLLFEVSYIERRQRPTKTCIRGPDQRMTRAHLATAAHQAYFLGATGIASFNFQVTRPDFFQRPVPLSDILPFAPYTPVLQTVCGYSLHAGRE